MQSLLQLHPTTDPLLDFEDQHQLAQELLHPIVPALKKGTRETSLDAEAAREFGPAILGGMRIDDDESSFWK